MVNGLGLDNMTGKDEFITTNDYTNGCRMEGYLRCIFGTVLIILLWRFEYLFAHWAIKGLGSNVFGVNLGSVGWRFPC